jgi:probable F420-dependent oxidoreductase
VKFGVSLLGLDLVQAVDVAQAADELGFESVWLSDHLVVPVEPAEVVPEHGQVPAHLPLYDIGGTASYLGATTSRIRIGTWVYVLPLRHPFVTARAIQTADILTGGRIEFGVGTGYLETEFAAAGVDFAHRGAMFEDALVACQKLWSADLPEHRGRFYDFPPVGFDPKPVQRPWPRIHIGGESPVAFRRAARFGDGWIGTEHTPESLAPQLDRLHAGEQSANRSAPLEITVAGGPVTGRKAAPEVDAGAVEAFSRLGVDRLIVRPWRSRREALTSLERFAGEHITSVGVAHA